MWPFFLDRSVALHRRINAELSQVLNVLLDIEAFLRLHPLIIRVEQDPAQKHRYRITDRLHGPCHLWEYDNTIEAVFNPKEDEGGQGFDVEVTLAQKYLFPRLVNRYRVRETGEAGVVEVQETVELQAFCLLVPYILGTLTMAHQSVLDRLAETVEAGGRTLNS